MQKPLPDKTQHSKKTGFPDSGGFRTQNPTKREDADPHLRSCDHRGRQYNISNFIVTIISSVTLITFICLWIWLGSVN